MEIDPLVQQFLAQKVIAVVGVSDKRETGCNANYRTFRKAGYTVYAVNPRLQEYDGAPCYADLAALPQRPDAVFILANPRVSEQIVRQCINLGVHHVWMHCMSGVKPGAGGASSSVSQEAVRLCRASGINVIPGGCPNQFLQSDIFHGLMRRFNRAFGNFRLDDRAASSA